MITNWLALWLFFMSYVAFWLNLFTVFVYCYPAWWFTFAVDAASLLLLPGAYFWLEHAPIPAILWIILVIYIGGRALAGVSAVKARKDWGAYQNYCERYGTNGGGFKSAWFNLYRVAICVNLVIIAQTGYIISGGNTP